MKTLGQPSGDPRRLDALEALHELAHRAADWPTDQPRRLVNEWTLLFLAMLRKIERLAADGDRDDQARAFAVAQVLRPFVTLDTQAALEIAAGVPLPDQPYARAVP